MIAVTIDYATYAPSALHVLAGDTVSWNNDSVRKHTVTATDGSFASGTLPPGAMFKRRFDAPGTVTYYCTLHAGMRGEVDVATLLLDPPAHDGAPGHGYPLTGRAALPEGATVQIEGDSGQGYQPAATTTVGDNGGFLANVTPATTTTYRAVVGDDRSDPVTLRVLDHTVAAQGARHGRTVSVRAQVAPAAPGQDVVLQFYERKHFGWWPVRGAHLDGTSSVRFRVRYRRPVRARVVLTLPDRATPLAISPVVRVR